MDLIEITRTGRGAYRPPARAVAAPGEAALAGREGAAPAPPAPGAGALAEVTGGAAGPTAPAPGGAAGAGPT
eukprot:2812557-Alexandrium_andersonii.AAC.1